MTSKDRDPYAEWDELDDPYSEVDELDKLTRKAHLNRDGGQALPSPFALFGASVLGPAGAWKSVSLRIKTNPSAASRPRVFRAGGVGYSKSYTRWRKAFTEMFPDNSMPSAGPGPFVVVMEHVFQKPKTTKLVFPRGDLDNLDKGPLDGVQKAGMIDDDNAVIGLMSTKRWTRDEELGHTDLILLWSESAKESE